MRAGETKVTFPLMTPEHVGQISIQYQLDATEHAQPLCSQP